ncbi:hypothetical protein EDD11_004158, partial [Mortierella claussenii]
ELSMPCKMQWCSPIAFTTCPTPSLSASPLLSESTAGSGTHLRLGSSNGAAAGPKHGQTDSYVKSRSTFHTGSSVKPLLRIQGIVLR